MPASVESMSSRSVLPTQLAWHWPHGITLLHHHHECLKQKVHQWFRCLDLNYNSCAGMESWKQLKFNFTLARGKTHLDTFVLAQTRRAHTILLSCCSILGSHAAQENFLWQIPASGLSLGECCHRRQHSVCSGCAGALLLPRLAATGAPWLGCRHGHTLDREGMLQISSIKIPLSTQ